MTTQGRWAESVVSVPVQVIITVRRPWARRMPATTAASLQAQRRCSGAARAATHGPLGGQTGSEPPRPSKCDRDGVATAIVSGGRGLSQDEDRRMIVRTGKVQLTLEVVRISVEIPMATGSYFGG